MFKVTYPYILYEHRAERYDANRGTYTSWDGEHIMWFYEEPDEGELDRMWRTWVHTKVVPRILSDHKEWTVEYV